MTINNIGELKAFIKDMDDSMPLLKYKHDMERAGNTEGIHVSVGNYKQMQRSTWDSFSGDDYSYSVYVPDENGTEHILFE